MSQNENFQERLTSHSNIRAFAKRWYWQNKRRSYLQIKRDGELDVFLDDLADSVESHAQRLVRTGTFKAQAVQWAIRAEIIGVDYD